MGSVITGRDESRFNSAMEPLTEWDSVASAELGGLAPCVG